MSALFGALSLSGRALPSDLDVRMASALSFRPADATGFAQEGPILLGARARWLSEEAVGQVPPFVDPGSGMWVVFDGRLDHRERLASALGLSHPASMTDENLVVLAYRFFGRRFAAKLLGDFALALWDPQSRCLILARDALGIRPLYFAEHDGLFSFASQPRALFACGVPDELDRLRVAHYLTTSFPDTESSFFRAIKRLPPGHVLVVSRGSLVRPECYFAFDAQRALEDKAGLAEQFRSLFVDAVRARTRTREPIGCLLSGGLDSSGLLGVLRELQPERPVSCFSARFVDFPQVDEGEFLALLDAPRVFRTELRADRLGPLDSIDSLHAALDEPFHAPNLFVYEALARLAHAQGTRVLLDGLDGDTVVDHGYLYLRELLCSGRPRRFIRALRALRSSLGLSYGVLLKDFVFEPEAQRLHAVFERYGLASSDYMSREFRQASGLQSDLLERLEREFRTPRTLRECHHRALTHPVLPFYLEAYDKAAAALGVDHRHPYFDVPLMEFCLALPPEQRLHNGWDRVIQRRAFKGLVPAPICFRQSKSVWTANFERQLFGRHRERIRGLIESPQSPLRDFCDLKRLAHELPVLASGRAPGRVMPFWCAVTFGAWLEVRHKRSQGCDTDAQQVIHRRTVQ